MNRRVVRIITIAGLCVASMVALAYDGRTLSYWLSGCALGISLGNLFWD